MIRTTNDICNDINEVLEDYEKDNVFIKKENIQVLKEELFTSLIEKLENEDKVDSSFVELVNHLYNSINNDQDIDFEHIGIYKSLFCMIEYIFPNISDKYKGYIYNETYNNLYKDIQLIKKKK